MSEKLMRNERCATCGRKRGLSPLRRDWGHHTTRMVPSTGDENDRPWQITNDLIVGASVYRNGGTCDETHLCDECLRIGLRYLHVTIGEMLDESDAGRDKDKEIAELTQRLGKLQHCLQNLAHNHNRMQSRLADVLALVPTEHRSTETVQVAMWEVGRGKQGGREKEAE
jgi:hypothetical protein